MAIPTYEDFMLPLLSAVADGQVHRIGDLYLPLAQSLGVTNEEFARRLPSGQQRVVDNRVGWARAYLKAAGLVESPKRGFLNITERGQEVLRDNPPKIDHEFLKRFESFQEFWRMSTTRQGSETVAELESPEPNATPEETIEHAHEHLRVQLSADLLEKVKQSSPYFFETVVLRLLQAMGYGGVRACLQIA